MNQQDLQLLLEQHARWLQDKLDGARANLSGANLSEASLPIFQLPPEEGSFIAYKKTKTCVLKIRIPSKAKRTSSLVGRKCRASEVKVLAVRDGNKWDTTKGLSFRGWRENSFHYVVGETAHPDKYDDDIRIECTHGIHFFMKLEEAKQW